ncbi:MAG: hypothetical protein DID92_2727744442 [Candidatus Nitrotoga sp. SPKER]|nr:MAG: hypothetical protein DID92_2727744442 [Candidatus Nitrotoga sp. SPKER]
MSSLLKVFGTVTAKKIFTILFTLIALHATIFETLAAPVLDTSFGNNGVVHLGGEPYNYYQLDTILVETSGKVVLAGISNYVDVGNFYSPFDYSLDRLTVNGSPDISFGTNGRVSFDPRRKVPGQHLSFWGKVRAAEQANGAITVVTAGSEFNPLLGPVVATPSKAFRFDSVGSLYTGFSPALTPSSTDNSNFSLGVRPDGRLLYGTTTNDRVAVLQQTMPDGTPDLNFGTNGKIEFAFSARDYPRQMDLVLLGDGAVVFSVLTNQNLRLYKIDSHGLPVTSFGAAGQFTYDFADPFAIGELFSLLSLSDGSLLAGIRDGSSNSSLLVIRVSNNGMLLGANNLLADRRQLDWSLTALPDASVVIARSRSFGPTNAAALYRLLPNNSFDASFGPDGAYPLPGMWSISALALDANSRLLVAGQDATSAVLARFDLSGALVSVPIVEFYNINLDHYFITADASEAAGIDSGSAGAGWIRTGNSFKSGGSTPVCRFYGSQVPGPNSHFYTLAIPECDGLKQLQAITPATQKRWNFESLDFVSTPPIDGTCPTGTTPVYRAYNNGFARGIDSNHRLSIAATAIQEVVTRDWINEGVVMCAPI